jgi:hypothetical protein
MPVRPALDTLRELRDGRFLDELSTELNDLTRQVRQTDKPGKVTITLNVKPVENDASRVIVSDLIAVTPPKVKKATLFYTTAESNLSRRDPNQPDIPGLEDVSYHDEDVDTLTVTTNPENETA